MPGVPRHIIDEILGRVDAVGIIGGYVQLKRSGTTFKGLCPFHTEKTPSFHVRADVGRFHCFGCQAAGDVLEFLRRIENLSFMEALQRLAEQAGVDLSAVSEEFHGGERLEVSRREKLWAALEGATAYYERLLQRDALGEKARRYLEQRGCAPELWTRFRLGASPEGWSNLLEALAKQGHDRDVLEEAGLVGRSERGTWYDRFRERLMFPILLPSGKVCGFQARLLDPQAKEAKYVNSPETTLFKKAENLYGYHIAVREFHKRDRVILVEGNMDVISMHGQGFAETVAPQGTALTEAQVRKLARASRNFLLVMDGDEAGRKSMVRSLPLLLKFGVFARAVVLPDGEDPDSMLALEGREWMEDKLEKAPPLIDLCLGDIDDKKHPSEQGVVNALQEMVDLLLLIPDSTLRDLYAQKVAEMLRLVPSMVFQRLRQARVRALGGSVKPERIGAVSLVKEAEDPVVRKQRLILGLLVSHPKLLDIFLEKGHENLFEDPLCQGLLAHLQQRRLRGLEIELKDLVAEELPPAWSAWLSECLFDESVPHDTALVERYLEDETRHLRELYIREQMKRIGQEKARALERNDAQAFESLIHREKQLAQELRALSHPPNPAS